MGRVVEPAACVQRGRKGNGDGFAERETLPDNVREPIDWPKKGFYLPGRPLTTGLERSSWPVSAHARKAAFARWGAASD